MARAYRPSSTAVAVIRTFPDGARGGKERETAAGGEEDGQ
jgi:hypothetical protein